MRISALLLGVCILLTGCSNPFADYRETEHLLVIQTMGIDRESGGVRLSLAASSEGVGNAPRVLTASGETVAEAMERIYDYSFEDEVFCYNVKNVLIGESAAEEGIEEFLGFICRSPEMRLDVPVFIVKGRSAEQIITDAGDDERGIADIMQNVQQKLKRRGGTPFTGVDILRSLKRGGSALVCALSLDEASEDVPDAKEENTTGQTGGETTGQTGTDAAGQNGGESTGQDGGEEKSVFPKAASSPAPSAEPNAKERGQTAASAGYAVIRDGKLCRYIDVREAVAADMLLNRGGVHEIEVNDLYGSRVTLEVTNASSSFSPRWDGDTLTGQEVHISAQYSVLETFGHSELESAQYVDALTAALETELLSRAGAVLTATGDLKADFLALGSTVERSRPEKYRSMKARFPELLPGLEFQVTVSCRLKHTNDMKDL